MRTATQSECILTSAPFSARERCSWMTSSLYLDRTVSKDTLASTREPAPIPCPDMPPTAPDTFDSAEEDGLVVSAVDMRSPRGLVEIRAELRLLCVSAP